MHIQEKKLYIQFHIRKVSNNFIQKSTTTTILAIINIYTIDIYNKNRCKTKTKALS